MADPSDPALTVVFLDLTGAKSVKARIGPTVTVKNMLPMVITRMNLPALAPDGTPVSYALDWKEQGLRLREDQTLAEASVREGSHLIVCPEVVAGNPTTESSERLVFQPRDFWPFDSAPSLFFDDSEERSYTAAVQVPDSWTRFAVELLHHHHGRTARATVVLEACVSYEPSLAPESLRKLWAPRIAVDEGLNAWTSERTRMEKPGPFFLRLTRKARHPDDTVIGGWHIATVRLKGR